MTLKPGDPEPGQPKELMVCPVNEGHDTLYINLNNNRAALDATDFTPDTLRWIADHIERTNEQRKRQ